MRRDKVILWVKLRSETLLRKPRETTEALKVRGTWTDLPPGQTHRECVCVVGLCRPRQETATKMRTA